MSPTASFFNSLKNERVHRTRYLAKADAIADLFDYIERRKPSCIVAVRGERGSYNA